MNNVHMGMQYGKLNSLKGLAVLVLDGEVCDEWQENMNFEPLRCGWGGGGGNLDNWV